MKRVTIIGAGSWGTALAIAINRAGCDVLLWDRNEKKINDILEKNQNDDYLKDVFIDPSIKASSDIAACVEADLIIFAVPAQSVRATAITFSQYLKPAMPILIAAKGIERGSFMLMSEVLSSVLPSNPVAVISGPNFAVEIAKGLPAATTVASVNQNLGSQIIASIGSTVFRPYYTSDIIGVQLGGAVKNVIAIACGITEGKKLGENARAAIITRGLAEIRKICLAKGGRIDTLMGLSGIGDLMLTCGSNLSRNFSFGVRLGQANDSAEDILSGSSTTIEGVFTADAIVDLGAKLGVELPICSAVKNIVSGKIAIDVAIQSLMARPFTSES